MNKEKKAVTRLPFSFSVFWGVIVVAIGATSCLGTYLGRNKSYSESCDIFDDYLHSGYNMIVNTSGGLHSWVEVTDGEIQMRYPGGQSWGVVAINIGKPVSGISKREKEDFSKYKTLSVELEGEKGSVVEIGLKDIADDDSGHETKVPLKLKEEWTSYEISLDKFASVDLTKLHIVTEFVFSGKAQTVFARKIQFRK